MPASNTTRLKPLRLQTIDRLRIKQPSKTEGNPCLTVMSAVLNCWASAGYTVQGCMAIEQQLRTCMDGAKRQAPKKSSINYHLRRMFPKVSGPRKRRG